MRFLVDAQLPPALARWIVEHGHDAQHVADIGLEGATDVKIWTTARLQEAVIVTKDEDFIHLALLDEGPRLVWIRSGNTRRATLLQRMETVFPEIISALQAGERIIEIR